jgi:hypothetical protein
MNCVAICPGLAVTLVDFRKNPELPIVTLPYEIDRERVEKGNTIIITDVDGKQIAPGIASHGLMGGTFSPEDGSESPLFAINAFYRKALATNNVEFRFK